MTASLLVFCALFASVLPQEEPKRPAAPVAPADVVEIGGQEMPGPGPEHAIFKEWQGTFDFVNKMRMGPDQPWMESKGVSTSKLEFGGFWLISRDEFQVMGAPFVGQGTMGYDPMKKKYVMSWVDSMTPHFTNAEGTYDAATKTMTLIGDMLDPATGTPVKTKFVTIIKSADEHVFQMLTPGHDGKDFLGMEATYKRRK